MLHDLLKANVKDIKTHLERKMNETWANREGLLVSTAQSRKANLNLRKTAAKTVNGKSQTWLRTVVRTPKAPIEREIQSNQGIAQSRGANVSHETF